MTSLIDRCVQVGVRTETGNFRARNEDSVYADPNRCLFIVADGMGGHLAGEKASATAVEVIPRFIEARLGKAPAEKHENEFQGEGASNRSGRHTRRVQKPQRSDPIAATVREALERANHTILSLSHTSPKLQGMGTTVVMVLVHDRTVYACWVGDSRAYLAHHKDIVQLTTDHTLAQAMIDQGMLTAEQARRHPYRNVLERYVGAKDMGEPEVVMTPLKPGDRVLLASDGLTGSVLEGDMVAILEDSSDAQQAADRLVERALQQGSRDNVSCIVVGAY